MTLSTTWHIAHVMGNHTQSCSCLGWQVGGPHCSQLNCTVVPQLVLHAFLFQLFDFTVCLQFQEPSEELAGAQSQPHPL